MRLSLQAKPESLSIEIEKTAIIVVDMQNDFGSKGGLFDRIGIDISAIQAAIAPCSRVLRSARRVGCPIVYLKMGFRPDLSDAGPLDGPNRVKHRHHIGEEIQAPDGKESRILIRDTWSTDIVSALTPEADDIIVYKHRFSGFFETDLDAILQRLKIKHLIFTGCTTSVCVESTFRDAMFRDYSCLLLADCAAEPIGSDQARSNHDATLLVIERLFGWVSDSSEFLQALEALPAITLASPQVS
jgi:ureidoacrylate peracid hydrolase